jgi:hypothetical protein
MAKVFSTESVRALAHEGDLAIQRATENVTSTDSFCEWMINNWPALVARGARGSWQISYRAYRPHKPQLLLIPDLVKVNLTVRHGIIRNTHSCPPGGVINWHYNPMLPSGYPGWSGRLEYTVENTEKGKNWGCGATDIFRDSAIYTGTGGGGNQCYGYEVILWEANWPGWAMWERLSNPVFGR